MSLQLIVLLLGLSAPTDEPLAAEALASTDPTEKTVMFEEVVVTANRRETEIFQLPYTVHVVRESGRTFPDALRGVPAVHVQKTAHGQGSPYIRGFTGFHNVLLIDGIRLNNSVFRSGPNQYWSTVDPLSQRVTEVVKGPASVMYGSDAVGGTVNVRTRDPGSYPEGWSSRLYYRGSTAEHSQLGRLETAFHGAGRLSLIAGLSVKGFGDLTAGSPTGHQPETGYEEIDGDLRVELLTSVTSKVVLGYQRTRQDDVPRTHKTIFAESFADTTVGNERRRNLDQERDLIYLQYQTSELGGFVDAARFSLSHQRQQETRDRLRAAGSGGDFQGFEVETLGAWGQFESGTAIGTLTYGFEYYGDVVDSFRTSFDDAGGVTGIGIQGPVADDARYALVGVFVQNEIDSGDRTSITLGARYTHAAVDADRVDVGGVATAIEDDWSSLVGNARLLFRATENWNAFVGLSQGFRAPNLSDLTKLDDTSAVEIPSPGLDPENFVSFELGSKLRRSNWGGQVSYWYTWIDDSIVQSPTGNFVDGTPEVRKDNIGDGHVHGIELEGTYRGPRQWSLFGNLTLMEGSVEQLDESQGFALTDAPLSRMMPATLNLGARFQPDGARYWIEGVVTVVDRQDDLALRDLTDTSRIPPGGTPGFTVYGVSGGVSLRSSLLLTAAVQNITDKNFRVHGSGQNEPGRNLILTLDARF